MGKGPSAEPVAAKGLGGQCVTSVRRLTVTSRGVDVVAEVKRDEGGPFESDVLTPKGLARFRPGGELDEDFGDDGVVEDVSGSTVTRPDGSVADLNTRLSPSGEVVAEPSPPVGVVPGDEVLAPTPGGGLMLAGTPRAAAGIPADGGREADPEGPPRPELRPRRQAVAAHPHPGRTCGASEAARRWRCSSVAR